MLLRDVTAAIAFRFQSFNERGFPRAAGTHDTDKRSSPVDQRSSPVDQSFFIGRVHQSLVVTTSVVITPDLLIILHQAAELLRTTQHAERVAGLDRAHIRRMHFRLVVVP